MDKYAWIITKDHLSIPGDEYDDTGTTGPRNAGDDLVKRLEKGEGQRFKMFDDDRILYYEGRYIGPDDERMFGPLLDFGDPNAGCTIIKYQNGHKWEVL